MARWGVQGVGGARPRFDERLLPDMAAADAINCDLVRGTIAPMSVPELVHTFDTETVKAYRIAGTPDTWLSLPSPYSSVVRSPLTNDTLERVYWTNPGDGAFWNTKARIDNDDPPFNVGTATPSSAKTPTVVATGGTPATSIPHVSRSYLVTYVDDYGQETAPCPPSGVVTGAADGTWTITISGSVPTTPVGKNYPALTSCRLYRTVTGQGTGAAFYLVAEFDMPNPTPASTTGYVDTSTDALVVLNDVLASTDWAPPPDGIDGLVAMPGGFLVGFSGNTIHFSEPYRPHAWPAGYDQSVVHDIVGLGVVQQSLVVITNGYPSVGSGTSPEQFTLTAIQTIEPCLSRGSIIVDLEGVGYASNNGFMRVGPGGLQNMTRGLLTTHQWISDYFPTAMLACRHDSQLLAFNGTGVGASIDYAEDRLGISRITTAAGITSVWNDQENGHTYICAGTKVYRWQPPIGDPMVAYWKSKEFNLTEPTNIGAIEILVDASILTVVVPTDPPLEPISPVLPDGVHCAMALYADGALVSTSYITAVKTLLRPPSGFKAQRWQFVILTRVPVIQVRLASTVRELAGV